MPRYAARVASSSGPGGEPGVEAAERPGGVFRADGDLRESVGRRWENHALEGLETLLDLTERHLDGA